MKSTFRILFFLFILIATQGCQKNKVDKLTIEDLKQLRQEAKDIFKENIIQEQITQIFSQRTEETPEQQEIWNKYLENAQITNNKGVDYLLRKNGIDPRIFDIIHDLERLEDPNGSLDDNAYEYLLQEYKLNKENFKAAFWGYEIYKIGKEYFQGNFACRSIDPELRDCLESVVGTLIVTAGAAFVSGGAALVLWLVSKGYATYQLIRACT